MISNMRRELSEKGVEITLQQATEVASMGMRLSQMVGREVIIELLIDEIAIIFDAAEGKAGLVAFVEEFDDEVEDVDWGKGDDFPHHLFGEDI